MLVGGFNSFEKYIRQFGSFPNFRAENKKCLQPPPRRVLIMEGFQKPWDQVKAKPCKAPSADWAQLAKPQ